MKLWLDKYIKSRPGDGFKEALKHCDERFKHLHGLRDRKRGSGRQRQVSTAQVDDVDHLWSELQGIHEAFNFATNNEFRDCEPEVLLACIDYQGAELEDFGSVDL